MPVGYQLTWSSSSTNLAVGETIQAATYNYGPNINTINTLLNGIATATDTNGGIELTGVAAGTVSIPAGTSVGNSVTTSNATTITVTAPVEDESYLNKRGLTHFWDNIDTLKQDKLTAGTNISISNNTISSSQPVATTSSLGVVQVGSGLAVSSGGVLSATGGGVADSVAWGHVTGTLADQTDLNTALAAKANSADLATVATSGSYNDLTNKPTIGNATLTIQKNSTTVDTFTANATSNKSINITVPTTAADVSALPASTKYGASIAVSINTTDYKVTTTLKDQDGNTLGTAQVIDLPLESVVVNGSYDSTNKKIVLTLQNGSTIDIPVADLVAGLQSEITSSNKLASDLVDDTNQTNKFVTAAEKTKLAGIATGAEVNQNAFSNVKVGSTTVAADSKTDTLELVAGSNVTLTPDATNDKVTIAATDTTYSDATTSASGLMSASDKTKLNGIASGAEVNVQSDWNQATTTADDYIKNKPTKLSDFTNDSGFITSYTETDPIFSASAAAGITSSDITAWNAKSDFSGSYNDLTNKPTIGNATLTIQKNGTNVQTFTANQSTNATANITVPTNTSDLNNDSGFITDAGVTSFNGSTGAVTYTAPVTSVNGSTGAVTVTNIERAGHNVAPTSDIPSAWAAALPNGESWVWYDTTGCFTNQPERYGHLETIRNGGEVYQRWHGQSNGVTYYRAGNSTGWWGQSAGVGSFRKIIDTSQSGTVTTSMLADTSVTSAKIDWTSFSTIFCNWVHLNAVGTITTNTLTNKMQVTLPTAGKYAIFYNMNTYNQAGGFNGEVNTRLLCGSSTSGTLTTFIAPVNWAGTSNSDVATFTTTADNEIVYLQASVNWPARGTCYISALSYLAYLRIG